MALQVWLPLNGTLENKGLSNVTVTNNGATVDNNGKIGKCYSFDGNNDYIAFSGNFFRGGTSYPFSICMWIYQNDTNRAILFGDFNLSGTLNFNIELRATTNPLVRFYWGGTPDLDLGTIPSSQWVHLCITYDGTTLKQYNNGTLVNSVTTSLSNKTKSSGDFYIGRDSRTGATALAGKVNDFRIYNHALSPKEVKEISKGLILHYKLDGNDIGITIPRNGDLIPDGVELYDYILSTGTLWIDTGVIANLYPIEFKTNLCFTDNVTIEKDFFGNFNDGASTNCFVCGKYSRLFYQWGGNVYKVGTVVLNQFYELSYRFNGASGRTLTIDGTANTSTATNNFTSRTNTLGMFSGASNKVYCAASVKMKYSQILINNILVRNFLPCTYLGEPGMWDTVENKFYRNQGTGQFTLGNKITLKEYEYLESSGTLYINTEVSNFNIGDFDIKYKFKFDTWNSQWDTILGTHGYNVIFRRNNTTTNMLYYVNSAAMGEHSIATNTIYNTLVSMINNVVSINVNGNIYGGPASRTPTNNYPLFIYASNVQGTAYYFSKSSLYYLQISKNNQLIRDFIPVSYNGTPGLWDKVEWKFYANAGSGSFTLGPEKTVQQDAPIFYDSSGYCNHGSITGTLTTNNDSPRYTTSTVFNGSSRITSNNINLPGTSLFTISCWVYRTGSQNYLPPFWLGNGSSALGIAIHGPSIARIEGGNGTNKFDNTGSTGVPVNTWTHLVLVYNGSNVIEYLNGSQVNSIAHSYGFGSTLVRMYIGYFWGSSFTGRLSDVRLYATALSEDDIKELYNTSAFVTDNGVFAEYELYEDNLSDVKKRGLLETANFYENGAESGYTLDTDKTRVASNYIISEDFIEI